MPRLSRNFLAACTVLVTAPASFADVTAEDVWTDWQSYVTTFGYQIDGKAEPASDGLVVENLIMSSATLAEGASTKITMDQVRFTELSDGSVRIVLPEVMPVEMQFPSEGGKPNDIRMNYVQSGLDIVASGSPTDMLYTHTADSVILTTTSLLIDGATMDSSTNNIEATFEDISGTTQMKLDSQRRYIQSLAIGSVQYSVGFIEAETDNRFSMTGQAKDMSFEGSSTLPLRIVQATDMDAMLSAGFEVDGIFEYGANASEFLVTTPEGANAMSFTAEKGTLGVTMGQSGLTYDLSQSGMSSDVTIAQFPIPLNLSIARAGFNLAMPLRKSETPEDFSLGVSLEDFSMSDALWGLFDPSGQLPRDPATIAVQLAGKARLLFDFLDPDAASISGNPNITPAEINKLDINKLQVTAVGAELTGSGGFNFDNSQAGAPKPSGAVDFQLVGGNGLIDRLVAIGLLPEQQAMGARMMMGLLAVPGDAPDTLNSKIEINEQGHIMANGQRIQ